MGKRENISVSASEVMRKAECLPEEHQLRLEAELERARALIQEGANQLDRGETVDGEKFFREWDGELDAFEAAQSR